MNLKQVERTPSDTGWIAPLKGLSILLELCWPRNRQEVVENDEGSNGILLFPELIELFPRWGIDCSSAVFRPATFLFFLSLVTCVRSLVSRYELTFPKSRHEAQALL